MQFRRGCRLWWLALLAAGIDRICKAIALRGLGGGAVTAIEGALSWSLVKNTGAAFGILSGSCLLPLLTFALAAGLLFWLLRHGEAPLLLRAGLWMIVGGGLGNLYDRLVYGYVIDFIRLDFVNFAVFNPADVFVCAGAALAVLSALISERRGKDG